MKLNFTTLDLMAIVAELQAKIIGCRVNNVYDTDNKTYLVRLLSHNGKKIVLLLESGTRAHLTEYEWPKNIMPSGFSMKLRKHIKNKRVSGVLQLGMDRIIDIHFGTEDHLYHLIVELYDRGNMVLTDHEYKILHLLRPRTDASKDVRYATHERYPLEVIRQAPDCLIAYETASIQDHVLSLLLQAKGPWTSISSEATSDEDGGAKANLLPIRTILAKEFAFGNVCIEHCYRLAQLHINPLLSTIQQKTTPLSPETVSRLREEYALGFASALKHLLLTVTGADAAKADGNASTGTVHSGYVFFKNLPTDSTRMASQEEFQPFLFEQFRSRNYTAYDSYSKAVDAYFSCIESQRTTERLDQLEKKANRKLDNIKKDHELRLSNLKEEQELDIKKAQLIEMNQQLVDGIILMVNHVLSTKVDWAQLEAMLEEAKKRDDLLARHISSLNLQVNQVVLRLSTNPTASTDSESTPSESDADEGIERDPDTEVEVVIDLGLNAQNNARWYYDKRRMALKKEQKTVISKQKAMKSAAFQAQQTLKDANTIVQIAMIRKPMWFEKFFWFISSENYLVVAGRDSQQNEMLVKRHLRPGDVYVHADLHGASSVIVKARPLQASELLSNPGETTDERTQAPTTMALALPPPPPKTLTEAGVMAVVMSSAWTARVVTSAWWVRHDQVSKTAPSGEYLTTGSFMIRGRKNYLPPCHFMYGFGILFKLDDESVEAHRGERRIVHLDVTAAAPTATADDSPSTGMKNSGQASDWPSENVDNDEDLPDVHFPDTRLQLDLTKRVNPRSRPKGACRQETRPTVVTSRKPSNSSNQSTKKSTDRSSAAPSPTANAGNGNKQAMKRGQRSKLKKIMEKYGDQDEDERVLRMKLLQGPAARLSAQHMRLAGGTASCPAQQVEYASEPGEEEVEDEEVSLTVPVSPPAATTELPTDKTGDIVQSEGEDETRGEQGAEEEQQQEEGDAVGDDTMRLLATLTGQPRPEDVLLYALPVCAPYSTLTNYKFKVKLTPGNMKRGKASKMVLHHFTVDKSATTREKDLLRAIKGEDGPRILPGLVKVTLPHGGSALHGKK